VEPTPVELSVATARHLELRGGLESSGGMRGHLNQSTILDHDPPDMATPRMASITVP